MRILLACAAFPPQGEGGGPISSSLIARGLASLQHEVRVVTLADDETFMSAGGVEVKTIKPLNIYWNYWQHNPAYKKVIWHALENFNPRSLIRMRKEIRAYDPDIVVTISVENINVATWLAARLERKPVAHLIHSAFLICLRGAMIRDGCNCAKQCGDCRAFSVGKKVLSKFVDGVAAESNFMLDLHLQRGYFPNAMSRVIPGAVDFSSPPTVLSCDNGRPLRVGFIGVHTAHKGLGTLAEAARALAERDVARFYVAGTEPPKSSERWRDRFPATNTQFLGWVNPEEFLKQIDVLVVPSLLVEAFGRVSAEAMCSGVPVICSRVGGMSENVVEGENGFTIAPGDHVDLVNKILLLAEDRARLAYMGRHAAQYAERFRFATVSSAFAAFLRDVSDARAGRKDTIASRVWARRASTAPVGRVGPGRPRSGRRAVAADNATPYKRNDFPGGLHRPAGHEEQVLHQKAAVSDSRATQ